jgi:hypothetical protein
MKGLEIKSLAIGLLLGCCVFLLVAAGGDFAGDGAGRYQIVTDGEEAWAIDTQTGQVVFYKVDDFFASRPKIRHAKALSWGGALQIETTP